MASRFQVHRGEKSKPNPEACCVCRPSRWGNPFKAKDFGGNWGAYDMHRKTLLGDQARCKQVLGYDQLDVRVDLKGRDLGCYCSLDQPCHADTLLEVANSEAALARREQ